MDVRNIRNFSIIAHIDHGKSTLADRLLEVTGTIEKRKMREQVLDNMELERERGITIKMTPITMKYQYQKDGSHLDRGQTLTIPQTSADGDTNTDFLYKDLTYTIRGACFVVKKTIGLGHKEIVYQKALALEFQKQGIAFESEKVIPVMYEGHKVGTYTPDFIVEGKIIIELKSLPDIGKPQNDQLWSYLKGSNYKLALLVNFGSKDVEFKRIVYDTARPTLSREESLRQSASSQRESAGESSNSEYILNLIDTPGHIDFSYEVSRALRAVEGCLLLVDATQGVQAQTLTTLSLARELGLVIIPVLSKIDSPLARKEDVKGEIVRLLSCREEEIVETSGKTGEGVEELLNTIIKKVPPPTDADSTQKVAELDSTKSALSQRVSASAFRALVFDFSYSNHKGIIVYLRVVSGEVKKGDSLVFRGAKRKFTSLEVGIFAPEEKSTDTLSTGEIGYIVTGIKEAGFASVGDTVSAEKDTSSPLPGYMQPVPVVWASVYPESQDDFALLKQALGRLRLSDSSFSYEEESSGALGRGFRCGFLGMLHLEIITERLRREFSLRLIVTTPSITYKVTLRNGKEVTVYSPAFFPEHGEAVKILEPWVQVKIITPSEYLGEIMQLLFEHEAEVGESETWSDKRAAVEIKMPLRELMRNFFDHIKSASSGFASLSYTIIEMREADVVRLDVLVAEEIVPAFSRVVARRIVEEEAKRAVEKLSGILPKQLFVTKIQTKAMGRIIASHTLSALKKDVTGHLYGGDITRKMKLWEKQKKGKKKMLARGKVNIPQDVFLKMMRAD